MAFCWRTTLASDWRCRSQYGLWSVVRLVNHTEALSDCASMMISACGDGDTFDAIFTVQELRSEVAVFESDGSRIT